METLTQPDRKVRLWPLTSDARNRLVDELARLRRDVAELTGQGLEEGIVRLPVATAARRLESLQGVLERADLVDDVPCVAIGRRATVCAADGEPWSIEIVLPGDGEPSKGRISADSPLGEAIIGARAGAVVKVEAPAEPWTVTVVSVD